MCTLDYVLSFSNSGIGSTLAESIGCWKVLVDVNAEFHRKMPEERLRVRGWCKTCKSTPLECKQICSKISSSCLKQVVTQQLLAVTDNGLFELWRPLEALGLHCKSLLQKSTQKSNELTTTSSGNRKDSAVCVAACNTFNSQRK